MDHAIQAYLRHTAARWRETERVGPFLATFTPGSENPYLNYAIPDDGAVPTAADVDALVLAFERRRRTPRLEYLPAPAPAVEQSLVRAGFTADGRLPVMTCTRETLVEDDEPVGIEVLVPVTDDELAGTISATNEAYVDPAAAHPPSPAAIANRRELLSAGGCVVLGRDRATGEPAGAGITEVPHVGVTELAGIGVRPRFRRRGVAAAVTSRLAREAFARHPSLHTIWLTPGGADGQRIYSRVGFVPTSEALHISRQG